MTPIVRIVLALSGLCLFLAIGTSSAHKLRAERHVHRLLHAGRTENYESVVSEYHNLPEKYRKSQLVKMYYDDAVEQVSDFAGNNLFPTTETLDVAALAVFCLVLLALFLRPSPKPQKMYSRGTHAPEPCQPTAGQISFIKRINNGIVPIGLTRESAALMIKNHLVRISSESKRQRIDISPVEFMSSSRSYREKMRLERERKRAQEKLARQQERERRRAEREEMNARKAESRLYDKRIAEEEKLIKAREDACSGVEKKSRSAKARAIQELQNLMNDILADKRIEPQEVRQLKAWLMANRQAPDDFAQMLKLIDDSLLDGIIDEEETQAIYEGVIDCLLTLRERKSV